MIYHIKLSQRMFNIVFLIIYIQILLLNYRLLLLFCRLGQPKNKTLCHSLLTSGCEYSQKDGQHVSNGLLETLSISRLQHIPNITTRRTVHFLSSLRQLSRSHAATNQLLTLSTFLAFRASLSFQRGSPYSGSMKMKSKFLLHILPWYTNKT